MATAEKQFDVRRIAAARGLFNRIRPVATMCTHLKHGFLCPRVSALKQHLSRFSRVGRAHRCTQQTDTQTTERATSAVIGCIYAMRAMRPAMRPNNNKLLQWIGSQRLHCLCPDRIMLPKSAHSRVGSGPHPGPLRVHISKGINQSIISLLTYDKTHMLTLNTELQYKKSQ